MNQLLAGAIVMGYFVAGLFFLRFWKRSGDSLFLYFSVAFWILAVQRFALTLTEERNEDTLAYYILRLAAFVLILLAIWNKNRESRKSG
ncbi:MAG: DUF5985 family protein [Fimbriimonas sp.]